MESDTPLTDEQCTEATILKAGKTAVRRTPADIDATIVSEHFFTAAQGVEGAFGGGARLGMLIYDGKEKPVPKALELLTFCVLVLRNGFTVTGESACVRPENFDPQIGRDIARKNAREKIWQLEGYLLKQRLHEAPAMPVRAVEIYSQPDCCFQYCAAPNLCKTAGRCVNG
jgi:hypothetical protein